MAYFGTDGDTVHMGGMESALEQMRAENGALKQKLHEVSRALTQATRATHKGATGHGARRQDRELVQAHRQVAELHADNKRLHEKTDSDVLARRMMQLEAEIKAKEEEIDSISHENREVQNMMKRNERRVVSDINGEGTAHAFQRDYAYVMNENSTVKRKTDEALVELRRVEKVDRAQTAKLKMMRDRLERTGKDSAVVVGIRNETAATAALEKENARLKHNVKVLTQARKTTRRQHQRHHKEDRAAVENLRQDVIKLAGRCGEQADLIIAAIEAAYPLPPEGGYPPEEFDPTPAFTPAATPVLEPILTGMDEAAVVEEELALEPSPPLQPRPPDTHSRAPALGGEVADATGSPIQEGVLDDAPTAVPESTAGIMAQMRMRAAPAAEVDEDEGLGATGPVYISVAASVEGPENPSEVHGASEVEMAVSGGVYKAELAAAASRRARGAEPMPM